MINLFSSMAAMAQTISFKGSLVEAGLVIEHDRRVPFSVANEKVRGNAYEGVMCLQAKHWILLPTRYAYRNTIGLYAYERVVTPGQEVVVLMET